jgi:hypothetical protein
MGSEAALAGRAVLAPTIASAARARAAVRERRIAIAQPSLGLGIGHAPEVLVKNRVINRIILRCASEQRHRRAQLDGVDPAEDRLGVASSQLGEHAGALGQPRTQHRMLEIGPRFLERRDRVALRHRAHAQAVELRKHEPHPVSGLAPRAQLAEGRLIDALLGGDEAPQVVRVRGARAHRSRLVPRAALAATRRRPRRHLLRHHPQWWWSGGSAWASRTAAALTSSSASRWPW